MTIARHAFALALIAVSAWLACQPASAADATRRISVGIGGAQANGNNQTPWISPDGRFVAFRSAASNLVPGDDIVYDIFLRDLELGTNVKVSEGVGGALVEGGSSSDPSVDEEGFTVAFSSEASNLVAGDTNGWSDVFVRDMISGTTQRISVSSTGAQGTFVSDMPRISANGRFVAFRSFASNLIAGDTNAKSDIFVYDLETDTIERVSVDNGGAQLPDNSLQPSISADGRYVAFTYTTAPGSTAIYLRDRQTNTTEHISVSTGGVAANGSNGSPAISANGCCVAFGSSSDNLVPGETGLSDVFVRDRVAGTTELVHVSSAGVQGNGFGVSSGPAISADGNLVVFGSTSVTLIPADMNGGIPDVFVHDRTDGTTRLLSVNTAGVQANGPSSTPSIDDNNNVVFVSGATNLVPDDTNTQNDIFIRGPATYTISVSASPPAGGEVEGNGTLPGGFNETVLASANPGYSFVNWTENGLQVSTDAMYTFLLIADRTLVANFEPIGGDFTVQVSGSPTAGGTVAGGGSYAAGSSRTVTAVANAGYAFVKWMEGTSQVSTNPSFTFTLVNNRNLVAHFKQVHTISVSASPAAGGTVGGGGTFDAGASRTVTAAANAGYRFVRWTEGAAQVSTTASYTFPVTANRTLVANFVRTYTISVSAAPTTGGTVTGGGTFDQGTSKTVIATAKPGYEFARWTQGGVLVINTPSYTFTLTQNRALVAQFRVLRRRNDLLADFGSSGLWRYRNNSAWQKLHNSSPIAIGAGDLDGNGKDEAIGSFPGLGLLARYNNTATWTKLHNTAPARLAVGDFDGNGKDDLAVDLGAAGIWVLRNNTLPFVRLHTSTSQGLAVGDLEGNGKDELLADLSTGLWVLYNNGAPWTKIYPTSPVRIATGDFDGNRKDEVVIDRGTAGLWVRYNNAGAFVRVHTSASQGLATGDVDGNGKKELIADLGAAGLWARYNNATWMRLDTRNPIGVLAIDLDRSGKADVVADFGATGLFVRYNNAGAFVRRNTLSSQALAAGGFD